MINAIRPVRRIPQPALHRTIINSMFGVRFGCDKIAYRSFIWWNGSKKKKKNEKGFRCIFSRTHWFVRAQWTHVWTHFLFVHFFNVSIFLFASQRVSRASFCWTFFICFESLFFLLVSNALFVMCSVLWLSECSVWTKTTKATTTTKTATMNHSSLLALSWNCHDFPHKHTCAFSTQYSCITINHASQHGPV